MAVSGQGFCTSAWNAFLLQLKHGLAFAWAKFLAEAFIFTGKLAVVLINCGSCYFIMKFVTKDFVGDEAVSSAAAPLVVVGLVTFIATTIFLGLFDETVLSLLTCLSIDTDLNGEPKYGPPTFHDAIRHVKSDKSNAIKDGGWEKADGTPNNQMA